MMQRVQVSPKQVFVNLNESLLLNCKLMSSPLAIFQWTKNDLKLKDSSRTRMLAFFFEYDNNSLYITKLLLFDHAIFKCIVSNRYVKSYDDAKVAKVILGYIVIASLQLAFNPNQENSLANIAIIDLKRFNYSWIDQEEMVEQGPGIIRGSGSAILQI
uniref:Ig-like domain-containing protein n=1 Tax=Wuchereria bancrofti TaxID=6293 RepID=A0A1I8EYN3_WUCBA